MDQPAFEIRPDNRDGKKIVYQDGQGRIMAADVQWEEIDRVDFSTPEPLFTFGPGMENGFTVEGYAAPPGRRRLTFAGSGSFSRIWSPDG